MEIVRTRVVGSLNRGSQAWRRDAYLVLHPEPKRGGLFNTPVAYGGPYAFTGFLAFSGGEKTERATHTTKARGTNAVSLVRIDLMATIGSSLSSKYFNENDFYRVRPVSTVEHRKNRLDRLRGKGPREKLL